MQLNTDLPSFDKNKAGWPWNLDYLDIDRHVYSNKMWPQISIVTPSYNQAEFLEETIRSVLLQGYPNLEYIIIDGGSTDNSLMVIEKYAQHLVYWVSEPDRGQFHAINKGFSHSSGEIMGWINSDDMYCPWTINTIASIFQTIPEIEWLTSSSLLHINENGIVINVFSVPGYARSWGYRGLHLGNHKDYKGWIQQESTFWRRSLWERSGGYLDENLNYAGDFELWLRFWKYADLASTDSPLSLFRVHDSQKSNQLERYYSETKAILKQYSRSTNSNSILMWLIQVMFRLTRRGGRRFGSRLSKVNFDYTRKTWKYTYRYVI